MPIIDPNDTSDSKPGAGKRWLVREGNKVWAITGFTRPNWGGTPALAVSMVVIKDLEPADANMAPPSDEGLSSTARFSLEPDRIVWLKRLAQALDYHQPFDTDSDEDLNRVFSSNKGIVVGACKHRPYTPKGSNTTRTSSEVRNYRRADLRALGVVTESGELAPDVVEYVMAGEADFEDMLQRLANKKAPAPRPSAPVQDDDIPF